MKPKVTGDKARSRTAEVQFCSGVVWTADRSGVIPARLKTFSLIHVCQVNHIEPFNILRVKNKLCTFISTNQFPRKCN